MNSCKSIKKRGAGFTLIELMVAIAIIGILLAIALPSYRTYIIRGNRAAAQSQMMDIANRQQQYFLANRAYADKATLEANGYSLPGKVDSVYDYAITVGAGTVPSFVITFTPTGTQAGDGDLTLNNDGLKGPAAKW